MPQQSTNPPVIFRSDHFNTANDPCTNPNLNYDLLLDFHKVGNSPSDNKVVDMIKAYVDNYPGNGSGQITVTKNYDFVLPYRTADCINELLEFSLDGEDLQIRRIPKPSEKTISLYNVSLVKGLFKMLDDLRVDPRDVVFEFTGGLAEYRIGRDLPVIKDAVLIILSTKNSIGIRKYLGVYDMSIPPEYRKK